MEIGCVNGVVHWPNSRILEFEPPVLQISFRRKVPMLHRILTKCPKWLESARHLRVYSDSR